MARNEITLFEYSHPKQEVVLFLAETTKCNC